MRIYNDRNKIYVECAIEEFYSPALQGKWEKTLKEIETVNVKGWFKGKGTSAHYDVTREVKEARDVCGIITCSSKEHLLEILNAEGTISRKMEKAVETISGMARDAGEKFGKLNPVYQVEFSADYFCDEKTFEEVRQIRPISRYKVEEGKIVAELRQKIERGSGTNEYSAHIQLANGLSKGLGLPVSLRSEIKGKFNTEIATDIEKNSTKIGISAPEDSKVTLANLNREIEKWNSCNSKLGTSLDIVLGSENAKIVQETGTDKMTSVKFSNRENDFEDFTLSYRLISEEVAKRETTVKYTGSIRSNAGEIEKNCRATLAYLSKRDFAAPIKMVFREDESEIKKNKVVTKKEPQKEKSREYSPKIQQRLL